MHVAAGVLLAAMSAASIPPAVDDTADAMRCGHRVSEMLLAGSSGMVGRGVECTARGKDYYVVRYASGRRAVAAMREWVDPCEGYFIARRGNVLIVPADGNHWYDLEQARYAARKSGGRVVGLCG
jgi:hypothetical protein